MGMVMRTFTLSDDQYKKWLKWKTTLPKENSGAIGGGDAFIFRPTGLGDIVTATYMDEYTLDLTGDNW
jgi:hypothetical protein